MGHYVTKQPGLRFYRNGEIVALSAGSRVPEAESLPNFAAMMRIGQLAFVDGGGGDALQPHDEAQRKAAAPMSTMPDGPVVDLDKRDADRAQAKADKADNERRAEAKAKKQQRKSA